MPAPQGLGPQANGCPYEHSQTADQAGEGSKRGHRRRCAGQRAEHDQHAHARRRCDAAADPRLAKAGADLVRVAVPSRADTEALRSIVSASPVPIIADVHFEIQRALEAVEAGAAKIRLNPGTLSDQSKALQVIAACKERRRPDPHRRERGQRGRSLRCREALAARADDRDRPPGGPGADHGRPPGGVRAALRAARLRGPGPGRQEPGPADRHRRLPRAIARRSTIRCTWASPTPARRRPGRIRSIAALSSLLSSGIGDTVRISYAADPVHEVEDAVELLHCLGLRTRTRPELIACPTCGRIEVDLLEPGREGAGAAGGDQRRRSRWR